MRESQKQVKNNIIDIESIKTELSVIHDRISNVAEEIYQGMNVERDNQTRELDRRFERVYKKMGKTE
ncbi:hypothetical protein M0Q97_10295 [Candidatus Dojkabacteria bacterium]|nr:hypothetical protein [Candidatus Dojkabacteria bacterium]